MAGACREPGCNLYREQRDGCYAFLTFCDREAAVAAQSGGSARYPHLEVKFGGRREFCLDQYNDQGRSPPHKRLVLVFDCMSSFFLEVKQ